MHQVRRFPLLFCSATETCEVIREIITYAAIPPAIAVAAAAKGCLLIVPLTDPKAWEGALKIDFFTRP